MWYLFGQVWLLLLIAFVVGWVAHWFFCCRNKKEVAQSASLTANTSAPISKAKPVEVISEDWKPKGFSTQPDKVDDLKRIKGIGAVIEKTLNELGIYQFAQITEWTSSNTSWVENFIAFPGRIDREGWIDQAKTLDEGGTTEFAKRVDKGDVDY